MTKIAKNDIIWHILRGDFMVAKETLSQIRKDVESYIGEEIFIQSNAGRNKKINKRGTIDSAYSNLFVVKETDSQRKLSYSYADVVMNSLEITKVNEGQVIMDYNFEQPKRYTQL